MLEYLGVKPKYLTAGHFLLRDVTFDHKRISY